LTAVLGRDQFRRYVPLDVVAAYLELVRREAQLAPDPDGPPPIHCADPADDYLIALAYSQNAALVSGDRDLLELSGRVPVFTPTDFLAEWRQ
jgi:predicted nucleic acid-binding protein